MNVNNQAFTLHIGQYRETRTVSRNSTCTLAPDVIAGNLQIFPTYDHMARPRENFNAQAKNLMHGPKNNRLSNLRQYYPSLDLSIFSAVLCLWNRIVSMITGFILGMILGIIIRTVIWLTAYGRCRLLKKI